MGFRDPFRGICELTCVLVITGRYLSFSVFVINVQCSYPKSTWYVVSKQIEGRSREMISCLL